MEKTASDRLIERAKQFRSDSIGISAADIARIPLTDEVIADIKECLASSDLSELKWGLSFAEGFLHSNPPQEFLKSLVARLPEWLRHQDWDVRSSALYLLVPLRDNYQNYRELMLEMLRDPNVSVRWEALRNYRTFLTRKDIPVLLEFQHDEYMTETEMGSPLIYALRNHALAAIEDLCQKQFTKSEKVHPVEGTLMVYWWDWKPFLDWWEKQQRRPKWQFWRK